ncbi:MAG TPA: DUF2330 domain-containing protein [Actinomycetota bacterium]|nr:DUF2330 domain-containing protein [Actinomycetota bacterium]
MGPVLAKRSRRRRLATMSGVGAGCLLVLLAAGPALACGGLIGPNGGVSLDRTTTLVGYHAGVEHYITAFTFTGGTGNFGSITPLPAVPTSVTKGGDWTLQRLERETNPPVEAFGVAGRLSAAPAPAATVLEQVQIDALDVTVLQGGGFAVGSWAKDNGFSLPPDAPALLDFYAQRSPYFLAVKYNAAAVAAQHTAAGTVTSIALTIPVKEPWVPLAILTLGKQATQLIDADVYLMTDQQPALLPAPTPAGTGAGTGLILAASEPTSPGLITDLRADRGGSWIPTGGMWLTYLRINTPAATLRYDLAINAAGTGKPSAAAAGLTADAHSVVVPELPVATPSHPGPPVPVWIWASGLALVLAAAWGWSYRLAGRRFAAHRSRA